MQLFYIFFLIPEDKKHQDVTKITPPGDFNIVMERAPHGKIAGQDSQVSEHMLHCS